MAPQVGRSSTVAESARGDESRRPRWEFTRRLLRQRGVPIALGVLAGAVFMALFAPLLAPHNPFAISAPDANLPPGGAHWFGTDNYGRDILSRVIYGSRVSVQVGVIAVSVGVVFGMPLGLISGYFGGFTDSAIMRLMDVVIAFPALVLALTLMAALGPGIPQMMVAIGAASVPVYARLIRGQVLSVREHEYVFAARSTGATSVRILRKHILPNVLSPLIVQGSLGVGFAILIEAALSFLGVGVRPPTATWGGMLSQGLPLIRVSPYLTLFPGLAIFFTVLAINMVGDALRDVLDPRLRGSR